MSKQFKRFSLRASALALILTLVGVNNLSYAATSKEVTKANLKLVDINGHWAQKEIQQFINSGYINGYGDSTFRPDNSMTRAEFVKVVNKYFGFTSKGSESFKDVNSTDWFYNDVCIAIKAGYINGYEDSTFKPNKTITREEVLKIVVSIKNKLDTHYDKINKFKDSNSISNWAKPYVEGAIEQGYLVGDAGYIKPRHNIKRSEAVTMLSRIDKKTVVNNAPVLTVGKSTVTITEGGKFNVGMFNATATDVEEGKLEVKLTGTYDINKVGTYTLTLVAKDSKGLEAKQQVKLIVEARKNTAPKVTANSIEIKQGDKFSYDMLGAKATDAEGDKVTISYEGTVKATEPGKYTITVIAKDDRGAESRTTVTVTVKEAEKDSYTANDAKFKNLVVQEMFSLVNAHRVANGVHALKLEKYLVESANVWSKYMADNKTFDHIVNGKYAEDVCPSLNGYAVGENIALTRFDLTGDIEQDAKNLANQLFTMWKNSVGHNGNMLDNLWEVFGFGFHAVESAYGTYQIWATQHFYVNVNN